METLIYPLALGVATGYLLISGPSAIVVDTGVPGQAGHVAQALAQHALSPHDVRLIILTHGHGDHIGSAAALARLTGAPIAMHQLELAALQNGQTSISPGVTLQGKVMSSIFKVMAGRRHIETTRVDIVLGDEDYPLAEYGVAGRIIHTPGHTPGSVSVLLDSGEVFVGDLAMNTAMVRKGPTLPGLATNIIQVKQSWRKLLATGATTAYPAHGKPFPAEAMRQWLGEP